MYVRTAALASGHTADEVDDMSVADAERIAIYNLSHNSTL